MIRVSHRFDTTIAGLLAGLLPLCVAVGVLCGINPLYGLLAAVGGMFAAVVFTDLALGFALFTGVSFLDQLSSSGSFSGTKVIGLVLFASWLARAATRREGRLRSFVAENPRIVVALVAMLGWSALSFAWAESPSTALTGTSRYALNMMLLPIAFAAVREPKHVQWVMAAFVCGAIFSALYGFAVPAGQGRAIGAVGDPNAEGTILAASIPLLVGLSAVIRRSAGMRIAAAIGVMIMFVGLIDTLSREALLALGAVMVAAVLFGGRWRRPAAVLLVLGLTVTLAYILVLAPASTKQRYTSGDTAGRSSIWTVSWRVIQANPVLGVGTDNFILVERRYISQPGAVNAFYVVTAPRVAHDAFIEAAADLGIPGLLTLVAVLAACITACARAIRTFEAVGNSEMELAARAVLLALIAVLTSDLFVAGEYEKFLWVLLALCPALLAMARRAQHRFGTLPVSAGASARLARA